jgi:hypothetical protein
VASQYLRNRSKALLSIEQHLTPTSVRCESSTELQTIISRVKSISQSVRDLERHAHQLANELTAYRTPDPTTVRVQLQPWQSPIDVQLFRVEVPPPKAFGGANNNSSGSAHKLLFDLAGKIHNRYTTQRDHDTSASTRTTTATTTPPPPTVQIYTRGRDIVCIAPANRGVSANQLLSTILKAVNGRGGGSAVRASGVLANESDVETINKWLHEQSTKTYQE